MSQSDQTTDPNAIAKSLSEAEKELLLDWSDFELGRWLLRRMMVFPSRKQGRTALGASFRRTLLEGSDNDGS